MQNPEDQARRAYGSGAELDDIVRELRAQGCSVIDCIKIVRAITGWELRTAKIFVHNSQGWSDKRAQFDAFHEQLFRFAEEEGLITEPERRGEADGT